ncbi:hypothetical protein QBC37DRAFT_127900 [Rhypophila decipiens]|uniref:Uncharacterized protein n=1 Tax=Rhypophila decipiens TaxID=261697 RepID=A0AAN6XVP1_9PEZI|nr:hypothetical protein QBC37DRAFT_127900 [Rhypophila decipiens]
MSVYLHFNFSIRMSVLLFGSSIPQLVTARKETKAKLVIGFEANLETATHGTRFLRPEKAVNFPGVFTVPKEDFVIVLNFWERINPANQRRETFFSFLFFDPNHPSKGSPTRKFYSAQAHPYCFCLIMGHEKIEFYDGDIGEDGHLGLRDPVNPPPDMSSLKRIYSLKTAGLEEHNPQSINMVPRRRGGGRDTGNLGPGQRE